MTTVHADTTAEQQDTDRFADDFAELVRDLRAEALQVEDDGDLARGYVARAKSIGFGRLRVPVEHGGFGLSTRDVFERVIDLASADPSIAHVFRGHHAYIDEVILRDLPVDELELLGELGAGRLLALSGSELAATGDISATLERADEGFVLSGAKYYSTGSHYSDYTRSSGILDGERVQVLVDSRAAGVDIPDDWDGFGQRRSASGSAVFDRAPVLAAGPHHFDTDLGRYLTAHFQLYLLSLVAGIVEAAVVDIVNFVTPRRRTFGHPGEAPPRENAQVQAVVGQISSAAHTIRLAVLAQAERLDRLAETASLDGSDSDAFVRAQLDAFSLQITLLPLALDAVTRVFEVGGSSATSRRFGLDRHWRNVRTIASHNPIIERERLLGDFVLNGVVPQRRVS